MSFAIPITLVFVAAILLALPGPAELRAKRQR
jgi:hypothetical protein